MIAALGALVLVGCANGFTQFYRPNPGAEKIIGTAYMSPVPAQPKVYIQSSDFQADAKRLSEDGYVLVGTSSFSGAADKVHESQAIEQGKKVGASIVLIRSQYKETLTGAIPYTVPGAPQVATVNTTGTVNAYGSSGYAAGNYNSTSTVTMPGTPVTYSIPYSVTRNDYFASYWAKQDPQKMRLGVRTKPLPEAMRRDLQRNTGLYVFVIVRGTPAFRTNFLEGDVITKIADEDVIDPMTFDAQLSRFAGQPVNIEVLRAGQVRSIPVTLNQNP